MVSEHPRFAVGLSGDSMASVADLVEIVCRSQISGGLVHGIMCQSQNSARSAQGIIGGVDLVRNSF